MSGLPPGFTKDKKASGLPPGFVKDRPPPPPSEEQLQAEYGPLYGPGQIAPAPKPPPPELSSAVQAGGAPLAAIESIPSGLLFNFEDELAGGVLGTGQAAMDWFKGGSFEPGKRYTEVQQTINKAKEARRRDYPYSSLVGEIGGGLLTGFGGAKTGITLAERSIPLITKYAPRTGKVITAGTESGIESGLSAAGDTEGGIVERAKAGAKAAPLGIAVGGGFQGLANTLQRIGSQTAIPAAKIFAQQKHALYDASEAAGLTWKPAAMKRLETNMQAITKNFDPRFHKATEYWLGQAKDLSKKPQSLREMDEFRRNLQKDIDSATGTDQHNLIEIKKALNAFLDNPKAGEYTGGIDATKLMQQAREMTKKEIKSETLEKFIKDSSTYAVEPEVAVLRAVQRLARDEDALRIYTAREQELIRKVAAAKNPTDVWRKLGRLNVGQGSFIGDLISIVGVPDLAKKVGRSRINTRFEKLQREVTGAPKVTPAPPTTTTLRTGATPVVNRVQVMINDPGGEGHGQKIEVIEQGENMLRVRMPDGTEKTIGKKLVRQVEP